MEPRSALIVGHFPPHAIDYIRKLDNNIIKD
jgi:hypothetical protein